MTTVILEIEGDMMVVLHWICGILFLLGIRFALIAWVPLLQLLELFSASHRTNSTGVLGICAFSLLSVTGYFIWISWIHFVMTGRFPFLSVKNFMALSLVHNLGWMMLLPDPQRDQLFEFGGGLPWGTIWLWTNIVVAAIGFVCIIDVQRDG